MSTEYPKLISLGRHATVEACHIDEAPRIVVTADNLHGIALTRSEARALYGALRQFDTQGLLED